MSIAKRRRQFSDNRDVCFNTFTDIRTQLDNYTYNAQSARVVVIVGCGNVGRRWEAKTIDDENDTKFMI